MSNSDETNVFTLIEFPADDPRKQPVIETLLWALEEVRMGRICSIGIVGVSSDFSRTMVWGEGVRTDQIPYIMGLLDMLSSDLKISYEDAMEEAGCSQDV